MRFFEEPFAGGVSPDVASSGTGDRRPTLAAILVCAVFFFAVYLGLSLRQEFAAYGDIPEDQRAVIGAREFLKVGFADLAFTQVEDAGPEVGLPGWYYHRHPSGGVVFLAVAQKLGLTLQQARAIPLLFTTMGLFGLFLFFREATGRPWLAVVGTAVYGSLSPLWLLADSYQFYSYAFFVKGIAFWLIAAGVRRTGAARHRRFALAGLVLVLAVTVFGLETIPAVALMSVFFPLFFAEGSLRARVRCAFACGSWAAAGIGIGLFLHILNVAAIPELSFRQILDGYFDSLRTRSSLARDQFVQLDRPYPFEVIRRCFLYMPQIAVAASAAVLWGLLRLIFGPRPVRIPEGRLLLAALLSEGLYFVFMEQHVRMHVHTTVHLTVFMATLGMVSLAMLRDGFDWKVRDTIFAGIAGAALIVATLLAPLKSYGNLHPPVDPTDGLFEDIRALDDVLAPLPKGALIAGICLDWEQYRLGYALALRDHPMIGCIRGRLALDLAKRIDRPYFALATPEGSAELRAALRKSAPVVGESGRFTLYGLAHFDPALIAKSGVSLDNDLLGAGRLVSPTPEELRRVNVGYQLHGRAARGLWMLALAKPLMAPTVVRVDIPEAERPEHVGEVKATFYYERRPGTSQPLLEATLRVWTERDSSTRPVATAGTRPLRPGDTIDVRVQLPAPAVLTGAEVEVRVAPTESTYQGGTVEVPAIRFVRR